MVKGGLNKGYALQVLFFNPDFAGKIIGKEYQRNGEHNKNQNADRKVTTPMHALHHALWAIRDRPEREKQAWREVFDYYVFGPAQRAGEHLPEPARKMLAPIDETLARQLRAWLIARLNR